MFSAINAVVLMFSTCGFWPSSRLMQKKKMFFVCLSCLLKLVTTRVIVTFVTCVHVTVAGGFPTMANSHVVLLSFKHQGSGEVSRTVLVQVAESAYRFALGSIAGG